MNAVQDVFDFIVSEGLAGGATGWDILRRRVMDAPAKDQLVIVTEDGGMAPEMGSAAVREPAVQVRVRGKPWDGDSAQAKAEAIFDALHGQANTTVSGEPYLRVVAMTSGPVFIGFDDSNRPEFTTTYQMEATLA